MYKMDICMRRRLVLMTIYGLLLVILAPSYSQTATQQQTDSDTQQCNGECEDTTDTANGDTRDTAHGESISSSTDEDYYFDSYADISIHEQMISDQQRTETYRDAIMHNSDLIKGKVVADIGAGTGILSIFCAHAGAKKVYAIEASSLAQMTRRIVEANNLQDTISVIKAKVEDIDLPEKVDIIVSEWMGYSLLYENMLPSVLNARDRWLREDGILLPGTADLLFAPIKQDSYYNERISFWDSVENNYNINMSVMKPYTRKCLAYKPFQATMPASSVVSTAQNIAHFELKTMKQEDLLLVKSDFNFQPFTASKINGFITWFQVDFPKGYTLSTSPYKPSTHWMHSLFYVDEIFSVHRNQTIKGSITLSPAIKNPRFLDIILQYQVTDGKPVKKTYLMDS